MSDILWPINKGVGVTWNPIQKPRDFIGVETPLSGTPTRGANEIHDYAVRAFDWMSVEHYPSSGAHNTLRVARVFLNITWDGAVTYSMASGNYTSYAQDATTGSYDAISPAFGLVRNGTGDVSVTLPAGWVFPSTNYGIFGSMCTGRQYLDQASGKEAWETVWISVISRSSTASFRVQRYVKVSVADIAGTAVSAADGDMVLEVSGG